MDALDEDISQPQHGTPLGSRAITPSTRISARLAQVIRWVVVAAAALISLFGAYWGLRGDIKDVRTDLRGEIKDVRTELQEHVNSTEVHLDKGYYRGHGDVVGKFDLNIAEARIVESVDSLRRSVNDLNAEIHRKDKPK